MTEDKAKIRMDGWQAALEEIRVGYHEGCLLVLRGVASGESFSMPPKYFRVKLVRELYEAGFLRKTISSAGTSVSRFYQLTDMGRRMLADNPVEGDEDE